MRVLPDIAIGEPDTDGAAMLIPPGAAGWNAPNGNSAFAVAAGRFPAADVPIAAICGATLGLARAHTSAAPEYLAASGYVGGPRHRNEAAVTDGYLLTAGPTAPVGFAGEILALLGVCPPEVLDAWHRLFATSDATAYPVLTAASRR